MIAEPVLSAGGIIEPPDGYLTALAEHCRARGMLLVYDEAQTGLGRTGDRFAFEHEGVVPDFSHVVEDPRRGAAAVRDGRVRGMIERTCHENGFLFYTTHAADPLPAAVGRKVIEILVRDRLEERARELGRYMKGILRDLQQRHEAIGDVRGRGLLLGVVSWWRTATARSPRTSWVQPSAGAASSSERASTSRARPARTSSESRRRSRSRAHDRHCDVDSRSGAVGMCRPRV